MASRRSLIFLLAAIVVTLVVPAFFRPSADEARFDRKRLDALSALRPTWLFVGNSMLYSRIDPARLGERLGAPVGMIAVGGSSSPHWYLALKNVVARLDPKPRRVFVFFRGRALTEPFAAVDGIHRTTLAALSDGEEPELAAILSANRDFPDEVAERLRRLYPLVAESDRARDYLGVVAATPLTPGAWRLMAARFGGAPLDEADAQRLRREREATRRRANAIFTDENLRVGPVASIPRRPRGSFAEELPGSFLPAMLTVAADRGLSPVFVRVRTRTAPAAAEVAYLGALRDYLEKRGFGYLDMEAHPGVTPGWFGEGDHIAPARIADYTDYFYDVVRSSGGDR